MISSGSCALLLEAVLFVAVAVVSGWEYHRSRQQSTVVGWGEGGGTGGGGGGRHGYGHGHGHGRDGPRAVAAPPRSGRGAMTLLQTEEAESGNSGTRARHRTNLLLLLACAARALLTAYLSACHAGLAGPRPGRRAGPLAACLAAPDLLYVALYGSLVALLAEMRQIIAASGKRRPALLVAAARWGLGALLLVSLAVCSARWGADPRSRRSLLLRRFLYFELGTTYLVMFVAFCYFGVRVCVSVAASNKRLFYRILALTLVCGVAMCSKGAFLVTAAAKGGTGALFPGSVGRDRFEALIALEDLLPSIAVAYLTARGKGRRRRAEVYVRPSEGTGLISHWNDFNRLHNSSETDFFSPGASTPGLRDVPFSYGSPAWRYGAMVP